jgi:hypothetical protein
VLILLFDGTKETIMARGFVHLTVALALLFTGVTILHAQDLSIAVVACPKVAKAGQDLKTTLQLLAANTGESEQKDISVEIVLKKSPLCPNKGRPASYSSQYYDGVLLKEGRMFVTLEPGKTLTITPRGLLTVPWDTPVGKTYYLCAVIDPEKTLKETNEENNCACSPIQIIGAEEGPLVTRIVEQCLVPGSTLTILGKNFGTVQGTVAAVSTSGLHINLTVSSWSGSTVLVRIPDDSRIQEGQQYTFNIKRNGESALTGRTSLSVRHKNNLLNQERLNSCHLFSMNSNHRDQCPL